MVKSIPVALIMVVLGGGCALITGGSLWQIDDTSTEPEPDGDDTAVEVPDDPDGADDGPGDPIVDPDVTDPVGDDGIPDIMPDDGPLCEPGVTWCLDENTLATCNGEGTGFDTVPCSLGCGDVPTPHCLAFQPSNVADDSLLCMAGTLPFEPSSEVRFVHVDTDTGQIRSWNSDWTFLGNLRGEGPGLIDGINYAVVTQTEEGGPWLAVFTVASMTLHADVELYATGTNAMVFFSCGDVTVAGILEAGADVYDGPVFLPGPAGGPSEEGDGKGGNGASMTSNISGGGGGGGFGGTGGSGNGSSSSGGVGGAAYGNETLIPLLGGSGGGSGADNSGDWGAGGPAGGALQISTPGTITVLANGVIESSGERGLGGSSGLGGGGGGGGSGGGVLLEAHTIRVQTGGFIVANGGGGGSGGLYPSYSGNHGTRGLRSLAAAAGGASPVGGACAGAAGNSAASIGGATVACTETNGGGGGGGAGRIRLNAVVHELAPDTLSPALSATPTTTTTGPPDLR